MAGPAYYSGEMNISMNEDWVVPFVFGAVDEAGENFTPIDLTGSKLLLEIRVRETDHEALVSVFSPDDGIRITDASQGKFQVEIERTKLVRLKAATYFCDLVRTTPAGYQERLWEGVANVVVGTSR